MEPYTPTNPENPAGELTKLEKDTRLWAMILHFSQLAGYLTLIGAPVGFIAPIVIWQIKKSDLPGIDQHGKNATNWIISAIIYGVISSVLLIVLIGWILLPVLGALCVIFPIIAGIKANNGEVWKYPLTIEFLK